MSQFRVLLTDYAWPNLDLERTGLAEANAELVVADKTDVDTLTALASTCHAIMTNWAKVPQQVIAAVPDCRIVARLGIGLDNIDVAYCISRGIPVTNVPDYCLIEVAEHALALLLSMARKVAFYHYETQNGRYELQAGAKLRRIEGQTLGIVGLGNIGRKLAMKAQALGMHVIASSRSRQQGSENGITFVPFEQLVSESDYISLHTPLTPQTRHMFGAAQFSQMRKTAYLINTARGGLIDHAALETALQANQLAGAALDVQDPEPAPLHLPPYNNPKVIVTPHAAFVSEESLANLRSRVAQQVATRLLGGKPENVVNGIF